MAMNSGSYFMEDYLDETMKILESACKLSTQMVLEDDDQDLYLYLDNLRTSLVECYVTIVQGIED